MKRDVYSFYTIDETRNLKNRLHFLLHFFILKHRIKLVVLYLVLDYAEVVIRFPYGFPNLKNDYLFVHVMNLFIGNA